MVATQQPVAQSRETRTGTVLEPAGETPALRLRPQFTVYRGYFVKFANENALFAPLYGLVYPFTYIYTKNVWPAL